MITMPPDVKNGVLIPGTNFGSASNVWVCTFGPYPRKRFLTRLVILPPSAALLQTRLVVFNEVRKIGVAPSGLSTGFAPSVPEPITAGTTVSVVWYVSTGTAPEVTMSMVEELF